MDNKPLISVITPTYNRASMLKETIDSILNQDYENIEYVIVDDGSTDNTREVVEPYLSDKRVKYYYHDNMGEAKTTNRGYSLISGELSAVINSDDPLYKMDYFSKAIEIFNQNPEILAIYPDWVSIDENSNVIGEICCRDFNLESMILDPNNWLLGPGMIIKTDVLKQIGFRDERIKYTGDLNISLKLVKRGEIYHLKDFCATHRDHPGCLQKHGAEDMAQEVYNLVYHTFKYDSKILPKSCLERKKEILLEARRIADCVMRATRVQLVSIIIPVYNGVNYMKEAIDSALNQTYKNIEVIVVNDGSADNTEEIARSYGDKIRYFAKENGGVATALNLAIKEAKGDYISWLSHDDMYYPNKIEAEVEALTTNNEKRVIVFSDFDILRQKNGKKTNSQKLDNFSNDEKYYRFNMLDMFFSSKLGGCTLLIPKILFEEIGYFDTNQKTTQDYSLWMKFFANDVKYIYCKKNLVTTRCHKDQDTHKLLPLHLKELVLLYRNAFDLFKDDFQKMPFWQFKHFLDIMKARTLDNAYLYMLSEYCNGDWNKDKPIIWMYWENKPGCLMSELNRTCLETIVKYNKYDFQIKILGDIDIKTYLPNINENYKKYSQIAHKADYIRFNLLYEYGGIWLDVDTILSRSLNDVKEKIEKYGFVANAYLNKEKKYFPIISFLGAQKHNVVCKNIIDEIDKILSANSNKSTIEQDWDCVGYILSKYLNNEHFDGYIYSIDYFYPYPVYERCAYNYNGSNFEELLNCVNPMAFGQCVANSVNGAFFNNATRKEILEDSTFIGHALRFALLNYDYNTKNNDRKLYADNKIWRFIYRAVFRNFLKLIYGKQKVKQEYDKRYL